MTKLSIALSTLLFTTAAVAATEADLEGQQYKSVVDAVYEQHKIAQNERLKAVVNRSRPYADTKRVINTFAIQYVDAKGNCTYETVDAAIELATLKTQVQFFNSPRMACW